jgi:hypothetical protein
VVTEFSTGISAGAGVVDITAGPDGNLWFTEVPNKIGRITPLGVITEFSAGITPGTDLSGITAGPDGNLWFTEGGGVIGRITPLGVVTEFSTGIDVNAEPEDIVAGPDGNLWFTESGTDAIGRITLGGVVTELPGGITAGATPFGMTAGPDGNLWFTEQGLDRVARITTGTLAGVAPPTIVKFFGAVSLPLGGSTPLSFTLDNPNATTALTGVGFTDVLPAGLVVSTPYVLVGGCSGTITANPGSGVIGLAGATLGPSSSCTFSVDVTGTTPGPQNNVSGPVSSTEGGAGGTATASVTVVAPGGAATIPALQPWGLGLLGLLLAVAGGFALRHR